jgi:chromate transporter
MVLAPAALLLALVVAYTQFVELPPVRGALRGMGAVAAGLVIATAFKLALPMRRRPAALGLALLAFAAVGLARWPLPWVLAGLAPLAIGAAWWRDARRQQAP